MDTMTPLANPNADQMGDLLNGIDDAICLDQHLGTDNNSVSNINNEVDFEIRSGNRPGDLGLLLNLHGVGYTTNEIAQLDKPNYRLKFEAHIARSIADFQSEDAGLGEIFFIEQDGETVACAGLIDRSSGMKKQGQLKWLLTLPHMRRNGIGNQMMDHILEQARIKEFDEIFVETTSGLPASMALYKKFGFKDVIRGMKNSWDGQSSFIVMAKTL